MKKNRVFYFLMIIPLAAFVFNSCAKEIKKKDIGLQLWSIRQDMQKDPVITIEALGKTGYTFVETADYSQGTFYGMQPADFKALVEKNNMRFLSSHTGLPVPDSASWDIRHGMVGYLYQCACRRRGHLYRSALYGQRGV